MDPITKKTSSFGGGRLVIDAFNEFPDMTERQIVDFIKQNKELPKKFVGPPTKNYFDTQLRFKQFKRAQAINNGQKQNNSNANVKSNDKS